MHFIQLFHFGCGKCPVKFLLGRGNLRWPCLQSHLSYKIKKGSPVHVALACVGFGEGSS
jgi:hypothetical protein